MKKKTYQQPKMEVVHLDQADIICTSGGQSNYFSLGNEDDLGYDEVDW